jgi:vanillate O-demethylase monooxygenase subunit
MWFTMNWQAPGCMINDAGVCPVGGAKEQGAGIFGSHLLTPETETTTHYLFAAARQKLAPPTKASQDPEIRQKLTDMRRIAFEEQDTPIIEAQQRIRSLFPERTERPVLLEIDTGPVRYRRVLSRLIEEERRAAANQNTCRGG